MSNIHFIGGEKGGVGKSVFARLFSQFFIDNKLPYIGLDADRSHATLTRSYKEFTDSIDLDHFESADTIMELALESEKQILIDLPAQSERFLDKWIEENDVLSMCEEMQINIFYWYLVDDSSDSAMLLEKFLAKYGSSLNCIVVKNAVRGNDFKAVDTAISTNANFNSVKQMTLPALHTPTMHKIDKFNFSFWGAVNVKESDKEHLGLMERQRTKVWIRKSYEQIEELLKTTYSS
jgi:hypothetical protein